MTEPVSEQPESPDGPERMLHVFALRDPLPLGPDGWTVVMHAPECGGEGGWPTCLAGAPCHATYAKFVGFPDVDRGLGQGMVDISAVVEAMLGRQGSQEPLPADGEGLPTHRWVLVTSTPVLEGEDQSAGYARSFGLGSDAVAALRQATNTPIPDLTIERVQPMYLSGMASSDGQAGMHQLLIVEHVPLGPPPPASDAQLRRAEQFLVARRNGHPVELYVDHKLAAQRATNAAGDYGTAILAAATAAEVLIKQTAWMLSYEASLAPTDPAPGATTTDLGSKKPSQLISGVLAQRLGGSWDSRDRSQPVGAWRHHIAQARNRLLHRGERPTAVEASDATWALRLLEEHIMNRLAAKATQYPRTAHSLLGDYGLTKRDIIKRVEAALAQSGDSGPAFLSGYRAYVRVLDEAPESD